MKLETKRTIAWMVNNLCRYKPAVNFYQVKDALPYLLESLKVETDKEILIENLWTCSYISDTGDEAIAGFIHSGGILEKIANIILTQADNIVLFTPALRTMSNIVSGNDEATDFVIGLNIMPMVIQQLSNIKVGVRKEVCFFLSNVAAGSPGQIDYIFKFTSIIPKLKNLIITDDQNIRIEGLWTISNSMMGGSREHKLLMIKSEIFHEILSSNLSLLGAKGIRVLLEGLKEYLNFAYEEGLKTLEVSKLIGTLQMPGGPKDVMTKMIEGTPEALQLVQDVIETIQDYKEDVLGEGIDKNMAGLNLGRSQYQAED